MSSKYEELEKALNELSTDGLNLYLSMVDECGSLSPELQKKLKEDNIKLNPFKNNYQKWYTSAARVIEQIIPERLAEFNKLYCDPKRKEVDFINYSIYDYILGLTTSRGGKAICGPSNAIIKMETQYNILNSAKLKFKSKLFDIKEVLQADVFDNEIEAAKELNKKGFTRAAGAVAGVVLEKHLSNICNCRQIKSRKARPSIADLSQALKEKDVIDTPNWRFIQHLADIRNLCDHSKEREPSKDEVSDLISGVEKVMKTIF